MTKDNIFFANTDPHIPNSQIIDESFSSSSTSALSIIDTSLLPKLADEKDADMYGPIPVSNWLVKNRVLMSGYPGHTDKQQQAKQLEALVDAGIRTVLCLQETDELRKFVPYQLELLSLSSEPITFLHFPIPDGDVAADDKVLRLVNEELIPRFLKGEKIMIHCWGGHGRTGTISAVFLGKLYSLTSEQTLHFVAAYHRLRTAYRPISSPETIEQFNQVNRLLRKEE